MNFKKLKTALAVIIPVLVAASLAAGGKLDTGKVLGCITGNSSTEVTE